MNIKSLINSSVRLLNQPIVKENVKNVAGTLTFVFGLLEIKDVYQILKGRKISTEDIPHAPKWIQVANKTIIVCAKISLILSAGVSRPGVFIISSLSGCFFSTAQLNRVFGPNTLFAINPRHPRHVISLAAVILALPSVAQMTYRGISWAVQRYPVGVSRESQDWLTDAKVRLMALFNTVTSRPTLHIGNQFSRWLINSN